MMSLRASAWRGNPTPALGRDPEGKVLGIVGMGGIGRNLARKMTVFGMRVIYYNRNKLPAKDEGGATYVGFEELLKTSDVVSLSLPLNVRCFLAL
jgi:glyoxylate reductase